MALKRPLHLTSPLMHGQDVKDVEYLLSGHNRFKQNFHPGKAQSGKYDESDAAATKRAKFWLGYPTSRVNGWKGKLFGAALYSYLVPKGHQDWKKLPASYLARRKVRLEQAKKESGITAKALKIALEFCNKHYTESPPGSNNTIFGSWYGLNYEPWCAMFFTYCQIEAGDKRIFRRGSATAYAYWPEDEARHGHPYLRITHNPVAGDAVVYHHHEGHIGRFVKWENRSKGKFVAAEGNTSSGGSQDNGGACVLQHRDTSWSPTVFVRVIEPT